MAERILNYPKSVAANHFMAFGGRVDKIPKEVGLIGWLRFVTQWVGHIIESGVLRIRGGNFLENGRGIQSDDRDSIGFQLVERGREL